MTDFIHLNENECKVLEALDEATHGQEMCVSFSYLTEAGRTTKDVRRACRSLRRKNLAEFHRGLMNDDGEVAGSGYCISREGEAFLKPCDVCGGRIDFEYIEDAEGRAVWEKDHDSKTAVQILECEEHHNKSPKHRVIKSV